MENYLNEEENERLQDIIDSYDNEIEYYYFIFRKYLSFIEEFGYGQYLKSDLPIDVLKKEADKWSLKLYEGIQVPSEKYHIIYQYYEYLAVQSCGDIDFECDG